METLFHTIETLKGLNPCFVSVTYGAGGSTRRKTIEITKRIKQEIGLERLRKLREDQLRKYLLTLDSLSIDRVASVNRGLFALARDVNAAAELGSVVPPS